MSWAGSFLKAHEEKEISYLEKYNKYLLENNKVDSIDDSENTVKETKNEYIKKYN